MALYGIMVLLRVCLGLVQGTFRPGLGFICGLFRFRQGIFRLGLG